MVGPMSMLVALKLSDEEKLKTLSRLDQFRRWRSLDDKRYCLCCGRVINGESVQIIEDSVCTGDLRAICATEGCPSIPMDWILPPDEILSKMSISSRDESVRRADLREQSNGAVASSEPVSHRSL